MAENETLDVLKQIEKWIRITSIPIVKEILASALKSGEERKIYNLSDGRNQTEIAKLAKVSQPTVSNYWKKWAKIGIVEQTEDYKGRWKKSFLLEDFNINT